MPAMDSNLIWIDLEMTGLDPASDSILEIACVVTDLELKVIAEGPSLAICHSLAVLEAMDDWNRSQHRKTGLWDKVLQSSIDLAEAERRTLAFLALHAVPNKSPMCGNSICQDRRFMVRLMPQLEKFFHYRNLDVSTIKELAKRWAPDVLQGFIKESAHTALADTYESIAELKFYRQFMGRLAGSRQDASI